MEGKEDIKNQFNEFVNKYHQDFADKSIDYLGVNISAVPEDKPVFKVYYSNRASREESHALIDFLKKNDMVRYVTMVRDKVMPDRIRYDVGLRNRTDSNMVKVYDWLSLNTDIFNSCRSEIMELSQMKVTERDGFDFAGLYFLGFIAVEEQITVLKCHYFNRICDNPDVLHKEICYADDYYLSYLKNSSIRVFKSLSERSYRILEHCGGHLWMTGADYEAGNHRKYKIYIKNPKDVWEGLLKTFDSDLFVDLRRRIAEVMAWNKDQRDFFCEGIAICEDELEDVSINFYFRQK